MQWKEMGIGRILVKEIEIVTATENKSDLPGNKFDSNFIPRREPLQNSNTFEIPNSTETRNVH